MGIFKPSFINEANTHINRKKYYDTLIFDFGDVLDKRDKEFMYTYYENNIDSEELSIDEFKNIIKGYPKFMFNKYGSFRTGRNIDEQYRKSLDERYAPYLDQAIECMNGMAKLYDYTIPMLKSLKEKGYTLYYLTNKSKWNWERHGAKERLEPIMEYFSDGIVSCDVGLEKPDVRIYEMLIEKTGLNPSTSLFFDDKEANINGAKKVGIDGIVFTEATVKEIMNLPRVNIESYLSEIIDESYIEESNNTPVKKSYGINIDGKYNAIVEINGESARMRGRSELLIIKDNMIYLSKTKKGLCGNYDVPGGGWDKGEDHSKSAIREAQEEARLKSKNVKYSGYYTVVYDQPHEWIRNKVDPKYQWRGYYTEVFIGEYDGRYNGKIADIDKDELIDTGKFYPIEEVYEELHPVHQKAIDKYQVVTESKLQKEVEEVFGECRDATREEQQSILNHIKNISEPTGINFYDEYMSEAVINSRNNISSKFLEKRDTCCNLENWDENKYNMLFITGLSGSGKTTLGIDLRKEFNCKRIELDNIAAYYMRKVIETNRKEKIYNYVKDECPEAVEFFDKNKNKYIIDNWSECIPIIIDFLNWFVSKFSSNGQLYIINGAQIPDVYDVEYFKERPIIIKDSNALKSFIRRTGREVGGDNAIQKFKSFTHHIKMITRPSYIKSSIKMTKYAKTINNESVIYEATSSMDRKYRCPYCDNLYKRKDLPRHIENKHEDLIPKEMTPLQITFNSVNNKSHGTCTECGEDSPWNEEKGRYDRICSKKSCHDSYVKKMKSRMIKKYGKEHILDDAQVQKRMLENRKISGTYVWSDGHKFSYCGSYEKALLEFLDKVLCCKSEDIVTPGPVIDYSYNGKIHKWIMDVYYIPYNLCIDVKDGGSNPNNRPMEEYREKQEAKEQSLSKLDKFNYIRLTDNDFTQLFDIFLELKMNLLENDNSRVININEQCSTTINALPPISQEKGEYIIQYMMKNTFTKGYGYCTNNELTDDIHIIDSFGKSKILHRDEFLNMVDEYTIFKYNGNHIEESYEYDSYPIDYYYTKLTGRRLIDDRQIFIDSDFCIESKLEDKLEALKEVYISSLNNTSILENEIGFDRNGIFRYNPQTGLRTKSYDSLEKINKDEIKIIGL